MTRTFDGRSLKNLRGIHPDLRTVCESCLQISPLTFVITDGLRTTEEQARLVAAGASRTMRSRHLTGHAIDFVPVKDGKISWDFDDLKLVADAFKSAAHALGVPIVWGGDWKNFQDGPHIELSRQRYPG